MAIGERHCGTLEEKELEHGYFDRHLTIRTEGGDEAAAWLAADEPERWLWPGRIPQAGLTLVVGEPRSGKTTFVLELAARLSRGAAWPPEAGPKSKVESPKSGETGPRSKVQSPSSEEDRSQRVQDSGFGIQRGAEARVPGCEEPAVGAYEGTGPKSSVQGRKSGKDARNPQSAIQNPQSDLSAYGANGGNTAETPIGAQERVSGSKFQVSGCGEALEGHNLEPETQNLEPDPALGAQPDRNLKPETRDLEPDPAVGAQPDRNLEPGTRTLEPDPAIGAQPDRNLKPGTRNLEPDGPYDNVWRLEPLPPPEPIANRVYLWNTKDSPLKVVEPTLAAFGADLFHISRQVTSYYGPERFGPAGELHRDRVTRCLSNSLGRMPDCRAVIVDQITLRIRKGELDYDSRQLLEALAKLAASRRVAVIAVVRMPQKPSGKALERAVNLLADSPEVEAIWQVQPDRWLPGRRSVLPLQNIFGAKANGLSFELDGGRVA